MKKMAKKGKKSWYCSSNQYQISVHWHLCWVIKWESVHCHCGSAAVCPLFLANFWPRGGVLNPAITFCARAGGARLGVL